MAEVTSFVVSVAGGTFFDIPIGSGEGAAIQPGHTLEIAAQWANNGSPSPSFSYTGGTPTTPPTNRVAWSSPGSGSISSGVWTWVVEPGITNIRMTFSPSDDGNAIITAFEDVTAIKVPGSPPAWAGAAATTATSPTIASVEAGAIVHAGVDIASGSEPVSIVTAGGTVVGEGPERKGFVARFSQVTTGTVSGKQFSWPTAGAYRPRAWAIAYEFPPPDPPIEATLMSEAYPGASGDVADGAAIIPNPTTPANSVVLATNKDANGGLYVLDMGGEILSSVTGFAANSVDWRDTTGITGWDGRILVMTCNRNSGSFQLRFYWFDRSTRALTLASTVSLGYEPYGTCLGHVNGALYAYVSERGPDDTSPRDMFQYLLTRSGDSVSIGSAVRTIEVSSVVEGMVVDDESEGWFCSQEDVGLFRYSALATGGSSRTTVDTVGANLVADVEDVAIADTPNGKKLLVSSQGDSSYHVYDLATFAHELRFTVVRPGGSPQVAGTDGLDVFHVNLGPTFPNGLIVVHDEGPDPSRFAFVDAEPVFGEVESAITGTIESALPAFTQAAEGTVAPPQFTGEVASTLPAFTQSAEGEVTAPEFTGTAASVLPAFTQSADGEVSAPEFTGQISSTLPAFTQAAEGTSAPPQFDGEITSAMPAFTQSVEGDVAPPEFSGEISSTLPAFTQSADGTVDYPGTSGQMASVLPAFMQAAEGDVSAPVLEGEIVSTLPPFTQSAEGDVAAPGFVGTVASVLPAFTQSAEGDVVSPGVTGQIASTLPAFSQLAEGTVTAPPITGEIASVLPAFTQKALGPDTDLCWPSMTLIEDWVGSTLVPEGTAMILVEDGCRP